MIFSNPACPQGSHLIWWSFQRPVDYIYQIRTCHVGRDGLPTIPSVSASRTSSDSGHMERTGLIYFTLACGKCYIKTRKLFFCRKLQIDIYKVLFGSYSHASFIHDLKTYIDLIQDSFVPLDESPFDKSWGYGLRAGVNHNELLPLVMSVIMVSKFWIVITGVGAMCVSHFKDARGILGEHLINSFVAML